MIKISGENQIPSKLVPLASNELSAALTMASIRFSRFPDDAKKAAVCPLDKGGPNRTVERNSLPVNVL